MFTVALAAGTLALGASVVATSAPASAHTPEASATCSDLTVALENYSVGSNGAMINTISVEIDSEVVEEARFGSSLHEVYPLGDTEVAHEYLVEIDASGTQYDREFVGSSVPCESEAAHDASAELSVAPATCDLDGALVLGETTNATWDEPTAVTGPAQYEVTATADPKHEFADGTTTKTFTGALEGMLDPDEAPCASLVVVPERPAPLRDVTDETAVDCTSMTQTTVTTTSTTDWMMDEPTNTWVTMPAVVTTSSATAAVAAADCTTPALVAPPTPLATTPVTPVTPADTSARTLPVERLASTGSDAAAVAPIGAAILLAGAVLVIAQRLGTKRAARK
jgi:hypothetical protein